MSMMRKSALTLFLLACSVSPGIAELSEKMTPASNNPSIEASNDDFAAGPLERFLAGDQHPELSESILQQHALATLRSVAPMSGDFGREGNQAPILFGSHQQGVASSMPLTNVAFSGDPNSLALSSAHFVGSGAVVGDAPSIIASGGTLSPTTMISIAAVPAETPPITPVPLPPAALLLGSGLLALPTLRRFFTTSVRLTL